MKMPHDFMQSSRFLRDEHVCKRCGLLEIEHERNLPSQSTHVWTTYHRNGKSLDCDPGCVERDNETKSA